MLSRLLAAVLSVVLILDPAFAHPLPRPLSPALAHTVDFSHQAVVFPSGLFSSIPNRLAKVTLLGWAAILVTTLATVQTMSAQVGAQTAGSTTRAALEHWMLGNFRLFYNPVIAGILAGILASTLIITVTLWHTLADRRALKAALKGQRSDISNSVYDLRRATPDIVRPMKELNPTVRKVLETYWTTRPPRIPWMAVVAAATVFSMVVFIHGLPLIGDVIISQFNNGGAFKFPPHFLGMHYFVNMTGSLGAFASPSTLGHSVDPYNNNDMVQLLTKNLLPPLYPEMFSGYLGSYTDTTGGAISGFVGYPALLWILPHGSAFLGHSFFNIFLLLSFVSLSAVVVFAAHRVLARDNPYLGPAPFSLRRIAAVVFAWVALVGYHHETNQTVLLGQLEGLYVPLTFIALWLWSRYPSSFSRSAIAGVAIGTAAAIKFFPIFILLYPAVRVARTMKDRGDWKRSPELATLVTGAGTFSAFSAVAAILFGPAVFVHWFEKIIQFGVVRYPSASALPSAKLYLSYVADWLTSLTGVSVPFFFRAGFTWPIAALGTLAITIRNAWNSPAYATPLRRLLDASLFVAALPIVMPHWWAYYNPMISMALLAAVGAAGRIEGVKSRHRAMALLLAGYVLSNKEIVPLIASELGIYELFLQPLWSPIAAPSSVEVQLGPAWSSVPTLYNMFMGFPGLALIFVGLWKVLKEMDPTLSFGVSLKRFLPRFNTPRASLTLRSA